MPTWPEAAVRISSVDFDHRTVPGRSVAADSAENPPIFRVDLSATRPPRLPARSGQHGPGRRRAGRFLPLLKERIRLHQ